jgi:hypothetical protein
MKKIPLVVIAASGGGLTAAFRAWVFHHSLHEVIQNGMFGFVCVLILGVGFAILQRKA